MHYILKLFRYMSTSLKNMYASMEHHINEIVVKYTDAYISLSFKSTIIRK